jgi:hypothetical protein
MKPVTATGIEPSSNACGIISKLMVASSTPLAKPSAKDMKSDVGLRQSASTPPIGEAIAAAPATARIMKKSDDIENSSDSVSGVRTDNDAGDGSIRAPR